MSHREENCEDPIYYVEKILGKRKTRASGTQYLIKWIGYDDKYNTWEPIKNLYCTDMIAEYEKSLKNSGNGKSDNIEEIITKQTSNWTDNKVKMDVVNRSNNINHDSDLLITKPSRDLIPEKILAVQTGNSLAFLMKWENKEEPTLVLSSEVRYKWPDVVLDFYEKRIRWKDVV